MPSVLLTRALLAFALGSTVAVAGTAAAQEFASPSLLSNTQIPSDTGFDTSPDVASDGIGTWISVWQSSESLDGVNGTDGDIFFARSTDDGATWTAPATLNSNAAQDVGSDNEPRIATDGAGNWLVVWSTQSSLTTPTYTDREIVSSRSTDNGATWTNVAAVNSSAAVDSSWDQVPQIATNGSGDWVVVWEVRQFSDTGFGIDFDVLTARSSDAGATWTAQSPLNTNAATDSGLDKDPRIKADGTDWLAVWWSTDTLGGTLGTDSDILVARSSDGGVTWSAPAPLNAGAASDSFSDFGVDLATDSAGRWLAVWTSDNTLGGTIGSDPDILISRSTDGGVTWTASLPLASNAASESNDDGYAHLASDRNGNWVALWTSRDLDGPLGTDYDVFVVRSSDDGASWTAPEALDSNAATDFGGDGEASLASDFAGNWVAVWASDSSLGAMIGDDLDILTTRSFDDGTTWATVAALNSNAARDYGVDFSPELAMDDAGNVVAVWPSFDRLGNALGSGGHILVAHSEDAGATWSLPAALATDATTDLEADQEPDVATDNAGTWVVVWSTSNGLAGAVGIDGDILVSTSTDNGATWTPPSALNTDAAIDAPSAWDFEPRLTTDRNGTWLAIWSSSLGVRSARSTDAGQTWTTAEHVAHSVEARSPDIATDTEGTWLAVWHVSSGWESDIFVARSTNGGGAWTDAEIVNSNAGQPYVFNLDPQVTTDAAGTWVTSWSSVYAISSKGNAMVARSSDDAATWSTAFSLNTFAPAEDGQDYSPDVRTDQRGNWMALWYSWNGLGGTSGEDYDILMSLSADEAATWTVPVALHSSAFADTGHDARPRVATDGYGNWITVWRSDDRLGGLASQGVDDIFVARGSLCGDGVLVADEVCTDDLCNDSDPCTSDSYDMLLGCQYDIGIVDASSCLAAPESQIRISNSDSAESDRLSWKWGDGEAFDQGDLGMPRAHDRYALCVYDMSASVASLAASLPVEPSSSLWKSKAPRGLQYKDRSGASGGVTRIGIKTGTATRTSVKLSAKGVNLQLPVPLPSSTFAQDPNVVVQLVTESGQCWTSEFTPADTQRNTATSFQAKTQ